MTKRMLLVGLRGIWTLRRDGVLAVTFGAWLAAGAVGVLAGGVLLWRGRSVVLAVVVAVVVTAALRAVT